MADYRVLTVDLTPGLDRLQVVEPNVEIANVTVKTLPAGATLSLHFGQRAGIPVVEGDKASHPRGCVIENNGLFATAPAQPGVTAVLYVGMGDAAEVTR